MMMPASLDQHTKLDFYSASSLKQEHSTAQVDRCPSIPSHYHNFRPTSIALTSTPYLYVITSQAHYINHYIYTLTKI